VRSRKATYIVGSLMAVAAGLNLWAQDVQFRGPARDGIFPDTGLMQEWPQEGPALILRKEGLGNGYYSRVVCEGEIYNSGRRESLAVVTCLNPEGEILWETVYGKSWPRSFPESRNTPTIEEGRIYIMAGRGTIACLDATDGSILWSENTHNKYEGEFGRWGMAESLLLTDRAVISTPVGEKATVVALDKTDGSLIWQSESLGGSRTYASPFLTEHNRQDMIVVNNSEYLFAFDPADGAILWKFDIVSGYTGERGRRTNANTPLYHEGEIFITSGYNADALMLELSGEEGVSLKWKNTTLDNHHGGVVLLDGYIYGANWLNNGNGNWVCLEWETGKVMWEEKWINKGSVIYADGRLYLFEEKSGNVGLVDPSPEGLNLVSTFKLERGSGPYWAHMSIYDRKLLIRHGTVLFIYDIKG
jgi:outer membrane protein assembly factor BamB